VAYTLPDKKTLQEIGKQFGINLSDDEAKSYHDVLQALTPGMRLIEELADPKPEVRYPRTPGYRPEGDENRYKAWYYKTRIEGASSGKLLGKTVAVKDNVSVAGVPMTNGASFLEGYTADMDATVVTRVLDEGAIILGKAVCEYLCVAGNSATSSTGAVENPRAPGRSTGGSSNGSAALVASGDVDLAIGADQAGSIRMPASHCGIVGLKPTYGLVPYTGASGLDYTIDHLGPMTRTVLDCALMLEAMAGDDGIDGRQRGHEPENYSEAVGKGVKGLRIGVVTEGFGRPESEAVVDEVVRAEVKRLEGLGAVVEEVSIPWHNTGSILWQPVGLEGVYQAWLNGHGIGYGVNGDYMLSYMKAMGAMRNHINETAPTIKATIMVGEVLSRHGGQIYGKVQNLKRRLRAEYDAALERFDVLVMPTTPMAAAPLTTRDAPIEEVLQRSWEPLNNTSPFNLTGHPAISVCCGETNDGRPVGFMVVGRHFDESMVFRVAEAVHQES